MSPHTTPTYSIDTGTLARIVIFGLGLWAAYRLTDLILIILTSIVIAASIEPFIRFLVRRGVPRVLAVILMYAVTTMGAASIFYFFVPPLLSDLSQFADNFPTYLRSIKLLEAQPAVSGAFFDPGAISQTLGLEKAVAEIVTRVSVFSDSPLALVTGIFGGVLSFVLIFVISFYLAVQERGIESFLRVVTPLRYEEYVVGFWKRSERKIGLWMQGQLLLAALVAVLVYLGLVLLDIRYAFLLAILAGIFELIPIFGPILAAIPAVAIGAIDGGMTAGFLVAGFYVVIQQFENHLFSPLVVRKVIGVPPILSIIALIAGAKLAGFWGIILAVPLAAIFVEYLEDIDRRKASLRENGR
jgi:predicted PurR-regulated permease PerM